MPFIARGPTHDIPKVEIKLDNDVVIFRGTRDEATGSVVKGALHVTVREQTSIKSITMVLQGFKRFCWTDKPLVPGVKITQQTPRNFKVEELIYEKKWTFLDGGRHGFDMNAGELVYPFQEVLAGSMAESVEGLQTGSQLVYRFKAKIVRGKLSHDIIAKKHLRLVRTLAPTADELRQTTSCDNIWPNKIRYSISTPSKAVVFGTVLPFTIQLTPLLKGLTIGAVTVVLKETSHLSCPQRAGHRVETRDIHTQTYTTGTHTPDPADDLGRWSLTAPFPLPKSLNTCIQDCEVPGIKVRHKLKFTIQLHNPDGHVSELRASLPVTLFISPNHLMDSSTNSIPADAEYTETPDDLVRAPPCYNDHYLDALYSQLAPDTPWASGATTPAGVLSRNNSVENIAAALQRALEHEEVGRELVQVPSYGTAVRSRPPSRGDEAPSYGEVRPRARAHQHARSLRSLNGLLGRERERTPERSASEGSAGV